MIARWSKCQAVDALRDLSAEEVLARDEVDKTVQLEKMRLLNENLEDICAEGAGIIKAKVEAANALLKAWEKPVAKKAWVDPSNLEANDFVELRSELKGEGDVFDKSLEEILSKDCTFGEIDGPFFDCLTAGRLINMVEDEGLGRTVFSVDGPVVFKCLGCVRPPPGLWSLGFVVRRRSNFSFGTSPVSLRLHGVELRSVILDEVLSEEWMMIEVATVTTTGDQDFHLEMVNESALVPKRGLLVDRAVAVQLTVRASSADDGGQSQGKKKQKAKSKTKMRKSITRLDSQSQSA